MTTFKPIDTSQYIQPETQRCSVNEDYDNDDKRKNNDSGEGEDEDEDEEKDNDDDNDENDIFANQSSSLPFIIWNNRPPIDWIRSIRALEIASILYHELPGATISLKVIELELCKARWCPSMSARNDSSKSSEVKVSAKECFNRMTRENAFGCIAMFESGHLDIELTNLQQAVALCTENSIFVAGIMLSDPTDMSAGPRIRHLVGSIGQTGTVLLVAPLQPRIKSVGYDPMAVDHKNFAGERADRFQAVSMHLSFTEWKMPLDWESTGEIDNEVFLLESVISVQHNGQWIADIDVLGLEKNNIDMFHSNCGSDCTTVESLDLEEVIRIDTWEELLDHPPTIGVLRAKGNWIALLAAISILIQQGKDTAVVLVADGDRACWNCLAKRYAFPEPHIPQFIID